MDDGLDDIRLTIAIAAVGYLFYPVCVRNFLFLRRVVKKLLCTHTAIFFLSEFPQQGPK
jgi:hypothetical protein